ncbi:LOW QUALITY PROTEIN: alanine--tRNA ligase, cytoplasmic-like [Uloborus diversus]|uniref:LOW QUALITY PROTEIN: alanine--tRNA ligase, cytoplasmic-like n=1 Tax=Uloborus diversus TaxID=327109 RepID=UPI002409BAA1|nr:LOW QUALITY PROTEIN: alanine--tRNA ligase, cytoplasmic-like [Uloborus diversus]
MSYAKTISNVKFPSKHVRKLFLDYFINEKSHTFIPSSPVFLKNDPSLLYVNAGMNQFRSVLLNKTHPKHPFYNLKRAANSQKCIRLSGKHNDLEDVGQDLHHHTFFEMLGNWSFGDYSKFEACKMAWDLLTDVYGMNSKNLYVTYFGGDAAYGIPPDEECKRIWLEIGVPPDHIYPFGTKDNFWEMADVGPCGPCTEIHYDFIFSGAEDASKRINADRPDLIEIWNLVFIQYNKENDGSLKKIPSLNVDTGMGFERLTAVLQGTMSNYDTDIFVPLFNAIEKNFGIRSYTGKVGREDRDEIDTAYRIIADHSRMLCIAISDGLFPDAHDAGHVLRKIIRRAAYTANRTMKARPGVLSSLVPYVAETLDFFPEVEKHVNEIVDIVNEEEKQFHSVINKGRKARNKILSENANNTLSGLNVLNLHQQFGLEEIIIKDLASEINVNVDWEGYQRLLKEQAATIVRSQGKSDSFSQIVQILRRHDIQPSEDFFKYDYSTDKSTYGVRTVKGNVLAILKKKEYLPEAIEGDRCLIVTDKTNFYSEAGGQTADLGKIFNEDFDFNVENVSFAEGFVFHHGIVKTGKIKVGNEVELSIDRDHRMSCSQNHTATHLLNNALQKLLPHTSQRSSYVGPLFLRHGFSAKASLSREQIEFIEKYVNDIINNNLFVRRNEMPFVELLDNPNAVVLQGEEYPDTVHVVSIGTDDSSTAISIEPCCGTHVLNTADIEKFIVIPSKSHGGSIKIISAVTGKQASIVEENGRIMEEKVSYLTNEVMSTLIKLNQPNVEQKLQLLLKEVRKSIKEFQGRYDVPLLKLQNCEDALKELKLKLVDALNSLTMTEKNMDENTSDTSGEWKAKIDNVIEHLKSKNVATTRDEYKYDCCVGKVTPITANICAIIRDNDVVNSVCRGLEYLLVTDKTNFYAEEDDQEGDKGTIFIDDFVFKVNNTFKFQDYVFHRGFVENGNIMPMQLVNLQVNEASRLAASQNHTAIHLLNSSLKKELPYVCPLSAFASSRAMKLVFSSKHPVSDDQLKRVEDNVNELIKDNLPVNKLLLPVSNLTDFPVYKSSLFKECQKEVRCISIGKESSNVKSIEPCYGTHVSTTSEIGRFIITSSKANKDKHKVIQAVTGERAKNVIQEAETYDKEMSILENYVSSCLEKSERDSLELWDCLKEVKIVKGYHETELPVLLFREHQNRLSELTKRLTEATNDFVQEGFKKIKSEMTSIADRYKKEEYIVHKLESVGDGKKIINYAIEVSGSKPVLYFVRDGHSAVICSCSVPKEYIKESFNALLWIQPVAALLSGKARALTKDPEMFYSIVSTNLDKVDDAASVAKEFVLSVLNK